MASELRIANLIRALKIEFTKLTDGDVILKCTRLDDSVTWQRIEDKHAAFFPLHDLTHYAVETELGFRRGFYGLIAEGWDIADTTGNTGRGPLPEETLAVEYLVSAFSAERIGAAVATAAEFNELAATYANARGMGPPRLLTDDELGRVRARFAKLAIQWRAMPRGETLELSFPLL